jgi:acyl-CoA synthetase (AMP-forming)/AMP-acid ligase II
MSSSSEQKWEQNEAPLLGEEEREEQQRQHRESMEETTQHLIEDLQMERRQSMSLERTTLITADTTANAGEDDAKKNTAGTISSLDGGEKELPNQQPLAPPFRSAETFLSTASSPRGRAQAFLRNKLGPFAGGGGGGSPRSGAASSTPGTEQTLHTARESSVPLRPLLDQCEKLHREGRLRDKAIIDNLPPYMSLTELLPQTNKVALSGGHMDQRQALTHEELKKFIARCQKDFERCGATAHSLRIAVCVPNGPTLVTSLLATMHKHCCVPINPQTTVEETVAECLSTNVSVILYQRDTGDSEKKIKSVVDQLGLIPILIVPDEKKSGMFEMEGDPFRVDATRIKRKVFSRRQLKSTFMEDPRARVGLVLHTSGSSGKKKVVPITISQLAVGAIAIASSCELNDTDKCCNFMPLFHVGGICRNVLAPIFSGGSLAAMAFFDARDFWMTLKARESTWYYGAPTMHALIQKSGEENPKFLEYSKIRLVAAAAGPLPHTLSTQLRKTFNGAVVLPSYGMTECMPISCPPANYALEKPGCSGRAMCPDIAIYDPNTGEECKTDEIGAVCVRGEIVMSEYEVDKADASSLAREGSVSGKSSPALSGAQPTLAKFFDGNWFDTGDIGRLDSDGFLFITGRSKEVINRGGEIISPIEIEDAIQSHAGVSECACISVAHETLQECVGIVVGTNARRSCAGIFCGWFEVFV